MERLLYTSGSVWWAPPSATCGPTVQSKPWHYCALHIQRSTSNIQNIHTHTLMEYTDPLSPYRRAVWMFRSDESVQRVLALLLFIQMGSASEEERGSSCSNRLRMDAWIQVRTIVYCNLCIFIIIIVALWLLHLLAMANVLDNFAGTAVVVVIVVSLLWE